MLTSEQAQAINNQSPGNSVNNVGTFIRMGLQKYTPRNQDYYRFVDGNKSVSGDGKTWDNAFATISDAITNANLTANSGRGITIFVAPGDYIEVASSVPTLSASDVLIVGIGTPDDTLWYGSGTAGTKSAASDHLLHITGNNNIIQNLSLYTNKNTKASIYLENANGNLIQNCFFSPQTQDGVKYCIQFAGGSNNTIIGNNFQGALTAAILVNAGTGSADDNIIFNNTFIGTGIGVQVTDVAHNLIIRKNLFLDGSNTSENMTNAITISAGHTAGQITVVENDFEQSAANDISDSGAVAPLEMNNNNAT